MLVKCMLLKRKLKAVMVFLNNHKVTVNDIIWSWSQGIHTLASPDAVSHLGSEAA